MTLLIAGWANVAVPDRAKDLIPASEWNSQTCRNFKRNPVILWQHDKSKPIGTANRWCYGKQGLFVEATILSNRFTDELVIPLIKAGTPSAFSVGFSLADASYDRGRDITRIKVKELLEISVVSLPCNQQSLFIVDTAEERKARDFSKML